MIDEIVQLRRLPVSQLLIVFYATLFKHMFAHQRANPNCKVARRVNKVVISRSGSWPIHHGGNRHFGPHVNLLHSSHHVLPNDGKSKTGSSKVLLRSSINDTKIVIQVVVCEITRAKS